MRIKIIVAHEIIRIILEQIPEGEAAEIGENHPIGDQVALTGGEHSKEENRQIRNQVGSL
jgi:hypothetical protein